MPDAWPTLSRGFDIRSRFNAPIKLVELKLGDGNSQRVQDGINNDLSQMLIVYNGLSQSDYTTLETFIQAHKGGAAVTIPDYVRDITGATTRDYYISNWSVAHNTSPILYDVEVLVEEVIE